MSILMGDSLKIVPNAIMAIITAVLSAYLAARWSMNKFFKEKWWERKEKAYEDIINALYDVLQYCEIKRQIIEPSYSDGTMNQITEQYSNAIWRIKRIVATGSFTYSKEVEEILARLNKKEELSWEDYSVEEIFDKAYRDYKEALEAIIPAAKEDLKASKFH